MFIFRLYTMAIMSIGMRVIWQTMVILYCGRSMIGRSVGRRLHLRWLLVGETMWIVTKMGDWTLSLIRMVCLAFETRAHGERINLTKSCHYGSCVETTSCHNGEKGEVELSGVAVFAVVREEVYYWRIPCRHHHRLPFFFFLNHGHKSEDPV
jgi:hypothetical protein